MKRLFGVKFKHHKADLWFDNKQDAKHHRNLAIDAGNKSAHVILGPDHRRYSSTRRK